jgi:hypothetical protein
MNQGVKRVKAVPTCSRERQRQLLKSSFLGFIHFSTNRSSAGWALLPRMTKVTSEQFRCGREHVRVSKCRKTRAKVGSKTGLKRGPSRCPKHRKHRYTGKSSFKRGSKWSSKMPLIDRQINGQKYVQKSVRGEGARDRILVRRALA